MAIKKYLAGDDIIFSVVADTEIYNAVTDDITALQNMPWSGMQSTVVFNADGYVSTNAYFILTNLVPNVRLEGISGITTTAQDFTFPIDATHALVYTAVRRYQDNPNTFFGNGHLVSGDIDITLGSYGAIPVGHVAHGGLSVSESDHIYIGFLLCNDEMTSWKSISVRARKQDSAVSQFTYSSLSGSQIGLTNFFRNLEPIVEEIDPYDGAGDSEPGGGGGTFDYAGNPPGGADDFSPPGISAVDTGFVTLYNPTVAQLKQLSNYLWSNDFDLNLFKKIFNDPMDLFLGLSIVPVPVPDGGTKEVGIGLVGSGVYMTVAASQWVKVTCGSVTIPNFTGSYLDYDPYLSVEIYLPYIGSRALKADEVMGKTLQVTYWVDILSGACIAWIDIDGHVTYTYMGQCATSIPTVAGDWTNLINGILSVVGGAVGGAVKGGIGGAIAGGVAAASAVAVTDGKISVERAGTISSAGGLLAHPKPFLIINAPRLCKPAAQNQFEGYPSYITQRIGDCQGFTQIEKVRLQNVHASEEELNEILSYLQSGVIL